MVRLGTDMDTDEPVFLTDEARATGVYVIGTPQTGKTTLLKSIALQDMLSGAGLCVLDPHGDLVDDLLQLVPEARKNDVIVFAPGDRKYQYEYPLGLNIFSHNRDDPHERELVSSTVVGTFKRLWHYSWGPRMENLLRNSVLTLMEREEATLLDLWLMLLSRTRRRPYIENIEDPVLREFWYTQFEGYSDYQQSEIAASSLNKVGRFLSNRLMRNVVAQPRSAFDLRYIMDEQKILLVNLSKGDFGEDNAALLGAVIINLILIAALSRRDTEAPQRVPFHLLVDEYQNFATESFAILQSEARKFAVTTVVAHQYRDQLDDVNQGASLNVANLICFRVSGRDSFELAAQYDNTPDDPQKMMQPEYLEIDTAAGKRYQTHQTAHGTRFVEVDGIRRPYNDVQAERANQLSRLPNREAQIRVLEGRTLREFQVAMKEFDVVPDPVRAAWINERCQQQLGMPRTEIERLVKQKLDPSLFGRAPGASQPRPSD